MKKIALKSVFTLYVRKLYNLKYAKPLTITLLSATNDLHGATLGRDFFYGTNLTNLCS